MDTVIKIAKFLRFDAETSRRPFDLFHILWLIATVLCVALVVFLSIKDDKKTLYVSYVVSSAIMWFGEAYKQFVTTFANDVPSYNWYFFPFQFCSLPLYTYLAAAIIKKGKAYDYLTAFNSTYCLFAGTLVLLTPNSVFSTSIAISAQSMLHHMLMVTTAVAGLRSYSKKFNLSLYTGAFCIFFSSIIIAEILNFGIPAAFGQDVNMFFISARMDNVAYLSPFKAAFPHPLFVALYVVVFAELSAAITYLSFKLSTRKKKYRR